MKPRICKPDLWFSDLTLAFSNDVHLLLILHPVSLDSDMLLSFTGAVRSD